MHCAYINLKIVRSITIGLWTPSASSFCIDPSVVRLITRIENCACRHSGIWYLFWVRYLYSFTCYKEGKANLSDNPNHLWQVQRTIKIKKKKTLFYSFAVKNIQFTQIKEKLIYKSFARILPAVAFRQYYPVNMNGNTAISRKVVGEKCARDNPERYMGSSDYQYTVPDNVDVELSFVAFLYHFQTESMTSRAIVPIFFEEQWTQNHPQYLSGWSRALFPTTFLETAVYEMTHMVNSG